MTAPKTNMTVAELVRARFSVLTRAERQLANALMANYPMAALVSITEFARNAEVSTPTVLRTVKKLGFSGFPEFQRALRQELEATLSDPIAKHEHWASDAPAEHMLNRFADAVTRNLRQSLKQVDHKEFDSVVELLVDPGRDIHIVGGRITHAFADYMFTHLQVVRTGVHMLPASHALWPHHLLNMKTGDVLIMFDVRRYEAALSELAAMARERGVTIVLFTDQWLSSIAGRAAHAFSLRIEVPSGWDSGVATLFMVEALIASVENELWPQTSSRIKELEQIFDASGRFSRKI